MRDPDTVALARYRLDQAEMSRLLRDAFNQRQKTDHRERMPPTPGLASSLLLNARFILEEARRHVDGWAVSTPE